MDPVEAEHVVVVPVLGEHSQTNGDVQRLVMQRISAWATNCRVVPVLTWQGWRAYEGQMAVKPLLTELEPSGRARTIDEIW